MIDPRYMDFKSITLILTQADVGKKAVVSAVGKFSRLEKVDLFFVHRGVELVDQNWSDLPQGKRVYCAFDHKRLRAPTPHPSNRVSCPAGWQTLYDLGNLNRETGAFIEALVSLGCAQGNQPLPDLDSLGPGIVLRL
ncbi:MAG: hypothetical protein HW380_1917 [Magnetococcales bacterium]|nr:hypothetical protein [Magnetococcales bacterium]